MKKATPKDAKSLPWFDERNMFDHVIQIQLSSHGRFKLTQKEADTVPKNNVDLLSIPVLPQAWPFLSQRQVDVCSQKLHEMLLHLDEEAFDTENKNNEIKTEIQIVQESIAETINLVPTLR
jgi:hypothetical protein